MHYVLATVIIAILLIFRHWVQRLARVDGATQQPSPDECHTCTQAGACPTVSPTQAGDFAGGNLVSGTDGMHRRNSAEHPAVILRRIRNPNSGNGTESEVNHEQ